MKNIVVIGGGTGTFTVLSGLKKYPNINLTAIVSMADSGGSNRVIRDEFGLLPTSDIRQCLLALSPENGDSIWRKLFSYRFDRGVGISGMTFGNLFMAALADILGTQQQAIEKTSKIINVKGQVLPVSYKDIHLLAQYETGHKVVGEHYIDEPKHSGSPKITKLETIPKAKVSPQAQKAIKEADLIILGPGDLYTSVIANLVIKGVPKAIKESTAKIVYIVNLMTRWGQTYKFTATNHINEIEKYLKSAKNKKNIDCIIFNTSPIPANILDIYYKAEKATPVKDDLNKVGDCYKIIKDDLISKTKVKKIKSDKLTRSLIRHDSQKLAKKIINLL